MTKVLTFSKTFPGYHPRAGESTYFVEKLLASFADSIPGWEMLKHFTEYDWHEYYNCKLPKGQTVRSGNRFKPGDFFSPRIWSGKPYNSKQLIISNPIEVKKVWDFEITKEGIVLINNIERMATTVQKLAHNDGLSYVDFLQWFKYPSEFKGQIICWNEKISY